MIDHNHFICHFIFGGHLLNIPIVGGEDVKTAKPSPEGLLFAMQRLGCSKEETLYIGDSTVDAETAQAGGTDFAGILHGATTREELEAYPHTVVADSLRILI